MKVDYSFIERIIREDSQLMVDDAKRTPLYGNPSSDKPIIADFTEYSPLHKGHRHCMFEAKKKVPGGLFVAVIPGPLERSGRGLPYIMTRQARAKAAIMVGADVAVEGPPMGVMGSGQYSLCLARMFKALDADYIPRGYKPMEGFREILDRINKGHRVVPRPYRIVDLETGETILEGKLEEDNYVILSLSRALGKIGFDFRDKFIFVERLEGVSGTLIREAASKDRLSEVEDMLPPETLRVLRDEISQGRAPLHETRLKDKIIENANILEHDELLNLNLFDEKTANAIIENRPFNSIGEILACIPRGFSRHYKNRILSVLEAKVHKGLISKYIENYPSTIRVLDYMDEEVLKEFKDRIPHRRLEVWQ
ncbi:MAG: nucleotidyltransferase family protein [Methanobacteriales archaeon]